MRAPAERAKRSAAMRERLRSGPQCATPCEICGGLQVRGRALARDHDHTTGKPRGLLCDPCNRVVVARYELLIRGEKGGGAPRDDGLLREVILYLKKYGSRWR